MCGVEHDPWVGQGYSEGIAGQRIAVVGYSHWRDENDDDTDNFTIFVVKRLIEEDQKISFFCRIRDDFSYGSTEKFWNSVLFFNFLPNCVGTASERYDYGTREQVRRGQARFEKLLGAYAPDKVLVFTKRGWSQCPPTREERAGRECQPFCDVSGFTCGSYDLEGKLVSAYGLRHPERANGQQMRLGVQAALAALPLV